MNVHIRPSEAGFCFHDSNAPALVNKLTREVDDVVRSMAMDRLLDAAVRLCQAKNAIALAPADRARMDRSRKHLAHIVDLLDAALEARDA